MEHFNTVKCMLGLLADTNVSFVKIDSHVTDKCVSGKIVAYADVNSPGESRYFSSEDSSSEFSFITVKELISIWKAVVADPDARIHMDLRPMGVLALESMRVLGGLKVELSSNEIIASDIVNMLYTPHLAAHKFQTMSQCGLAGITFTMIISRGTGITGNELLPNVTTQEYTPPVKSDTSPKSETGNAGLSRALAALEQCKIGESYESRTIQPTEEQQEELKQRKRQMTNMLNELVDRDVDVMVKSGIPVTTTPPVNDIVGSSDSARQKLAPTNLSSSDSVYVDLTTGTVTTTSSPLKTRVPVTTPKLQDPDEKDKIDNEVQFGLD